ncbi:hypothetical protein [Herbaspirillum sp.]|uniref:hypothetical protein n=1 Tax=Herbaspirillum sp. TaxID=1890675 RepID=UPI001B0EC6A8|nr:hypothetical protein [Herbaspirillum sp.]MBO9537925.1 hypothetical protein [Herbaspirillum sp.]
MAAARISFFMASLCFLLNGRNYFLYRQNHVAGAVPSPRIPANPAFARKEGFPPDFFLDTSQNSAHTEEKHEVGAILVAF